MQKFDHTCGLSRQERNAIKFSVKQKIIRQLPLLPDSVETELFLAGKEGWTFRWYLLHEKYPISLKDRLLLVVVAKLKKELHQYQNITEYKYSCKVKVPGNDLYHPKITLKKIE
jgi:predicted P-loop ATPase